LTVGWSTGSCCHLGINGATVPGLNSSIQSAASITGALGSGCGCFRRSTTAPATAAAHRTSSSASQQ
jgi:hypothetical protein